MVRSSLADPLPPNWRSDYDRILELEQRIKILEKQIKELMER